MGNEGGNSEEMLGGESTMAESSDENPSCSTLNVGCVSASGINSPISRLPFRIKDFARIPSSGILGEWPEPGPEAKWEVDALGLGMGDPVALWAGDPLGVRRGEGRGNNWSSSSSMMADETSSGKEGLVLDGEESLNSPISLDLRRLSTSSTLIEEAAPSLTTETSSGPCWEGDTVNPQSESALELRRLRAPRENFSTQASPSFRHSSVMETQSEQQERRGTVGRGFPVLSNTGELGKDERRSSLRGEAPSARKEDGDLCTRHGLSGEVGSRPRFEALVGFAGLKLGKGTLNTGEWGSSVWSSSEACLRFHSGSE
jgi:hypothetical protein